MLLRRLTNKVEEMSGTSSTHWKKWIKMSTKLLSEIFQSIELFVKSGLKRKENIEMYLRKGRWEIWTKLLAGFYKHCDELKGKKKRAEKKQ